MDFSNNSDENPDDSDFLDNPFDPDISTIEKTRTTGIFIGNIDIIGDIRSVSRIWGTYNMLI